MAVDAATRERWAREDAARKGLDVLTTKGKLERALDLVVAERDRQDVLKAVGRFQHTCADNPGLADVEKLAVLVEEVGEVAREVLGGAELVHDGTPSQEKLRTELVQCAAISLAWIEALS